MHLNPFLSWFLWTADNIVKCRHPEIILIEFLLELKGF